MRETGLGEEELIKIQYPHVIQKSVFQVYTGRGIATPVGTHLLWGTYGSSDSNGSPDSLRSERDHKSVMTQPYIGHIYSAQREDSVQRNSKKNRKHNFL